MGTFDWDLLQDTVRRAALLSRITDELLTTLDPDEAMRRLARLVVPGLADWCVVPLIDDTSPSGIRAGLYDAESWHADPALRGTTDIYARSRLATMRDDSIVVRAMGAQGPQLVASGATATVSEMFDPGPARDMFLTLAPKPSSSCR